MEEEKKTSLWRFLITYLLILIPFCAASIWLVNNDTRGMEKKEIQLLQAKVNQLVEGMEQQYELYSQTAMWLANLDELQAYNMIEKPVIAYNGVKTLKTSIVNATEQLEDVFIYYGKGDIYGATGVTAVPVYFVNLLKTSAGNDVTGAELIARTSNSACVLTNGGLPKYLVQHYPISFGTSNRYSVSVNYVIKLSDLQQTLNKMFGGQTVKVRMFLSTDGDTESICFASKAGGKMELVQPNAKDDDLYHTETRTLSILGLRVSVLALKTELHASAQQSQVISIAMIGIGLAISTLMSVWFSKRKKQSVDEIEGIIDGTIDIDIPDRSGDELHRLRGMVRKLTRQRNDYRLSSIQYRFLSKQQSTKMLMFGILADDDAEICAKLAQTGIEFADPYFYTACVAFDCAETAYTDILDAFSGDAVYPYRFGERNVIAFVASLPDMDTSRKLRSAGLDSLKTVMELLGASRVQFFISRPYEKLYNTQFAYREAVEEMVRHPEYHEAFLCWFWETDVPLTRPPIAPDSEAMAQLDTALRDGSCAAALDQLTAIESDNESVDSEPARVYRRVCVLQALLAAADDDEQRRTIFDESIPSLIRAPHTFYNALAQMVRRYFNDDDALAIPFSEIIDYVNRHYGEYELTLGSIAKRFNMNESYLSKVFRTRTGENYSDHITELRMAEIRRQLIMTNRAISEIFESCGYANKTNYSKKFKAYFGFSASEIRKMYRESDDAPSVSPAPVPELTAAQGQFTVERVVRPDSVP